MSRFYFQAVAQSPNPVRKLPTCSSAKSRQAELRLGGELCPENFKSKKKADASNVGQEVLSRIDSGSNLFSEAVILSRGLLRGTACFPKKTVRCTKVLPGQVPGCKQRRGENRATSC